MSPREMSQRDLTAELRGSRISAPPDVRARVRAITASAAPVARRFTWKRALVVALPAAAAIAAIAVVSRPSGTAVDTTAVKEYAPRASDAQPFQTQTTLGTRAQGSIAGAAKLAPAAAPGRVQRYGADLTLRMRTADGVSDGVQRALRITSSLGGHPTSVHASSEGKAGSADLVLKVPRSHVQEAITRLSALGTITAEQVDVQDLQAGLNAGDRTIEKLQARLTQLRKVEQTDEVRKQIATTTQRIERLQRAQATTIRGAHFATISLHLRTPPDAAPAAHGHGPLHGLGVAFRWIGIVAVYVLALGVPLALLVALCWLAARAVRRRRVDALLTR